MLREHFSKAELACKHCGALPPNGMSDMLLDGLEELRKQVGQPVIVNSGYRCPYWNKVCGGVYNSQHVLGTAADICVPGMDVYKLADLCLQIFDGVGVYEEDNFVHVDMRSNGKEIGTYLWYK